MATLRRRLYRKNDTGTYDIVHMETEASLVYMSNGNTVENQLTSHVHDDRYYTEGEVNNLVNGKANAYHTHDASQVVSGILPQHLGGTGYNSLDQLKNALGINNIGFKLIHDKKITIDGIINLSSNGQASLLYTLLSATELKALFTLNSLIIFSVRLHIGSASISAYNGYGNLTITANIYNNPLNGDSFDFLGGGFTKYPRINKGQPKAPIYNMDASVVTIFNSIGLNVENSDYFYSGGSGYGTKINTDNINFDIIANLNVSYFANHTVNIGDNSYIGFKTYRIEF